MSSEFPLMLSAMSGELQLMLSAFAAANSFVVLLWLLFRRPKNSAIQRGQSEDGDDLFGEDPKTLASRLLSPAREEGRQALGDRLVQAGIYKSGSLPSYLILKFIMILVPIVLMLIAASMGAFSPKMALMLGLIGGIVGTIAPGFYLDSCRKKRQINIRRALPDALDVIVVCVEGGLSLPGAFAKVTSELQGAHPLLAHEMAIVQREMQLGASTGEALRNFAKRFDMAEIRGLASVVSQAEKFGSSVVSALRVHAETLREQREFQAEEIAAKAAVKVLFPTLICIFPALLIVIMGPAAVDIYYMFRNMAGG